MTLDKLDSIAAAADSGLAEVDNPAGLDQNTGQDAPPQEPAAPDYATTAGAIVDTFAALVCGWVPECATIWTDTAKATARDALAPVAAKYEWNLSALPVELTAAVIVGPMLWQTSRLIAAKLQAERQAQAPKLQRSATDTTTGPAPITPAGATVTAQPATGPAVQRHPQESLYNRSAT